MNPLFVFCFIVFVGFSLADAAPQQISKEAQEKLGNIFITLNNPTLNKEQKKAAFLKYVSESGHQADYDKLVADVRAKAQTLPEAARNFVNQIFVLYDAGDFFTAPEAAQKLYSEKEDAAKLSATDDQALNNFALEFKDRFQTVFFQIFPFNAITPAAQ